MSWRSLDGNSLFIISKQTSNWQGWKSWMVASFGHGIQRGGGDSVCRFRQVGFGSGLGQLQFIGHCLHVFSRTQAIRAGGGDEDTETQDRGGWLFVVPTYFLLFSTIWKDNKVM